MDTLFTYTTLFRSTMHIAGRADPLVQEQMAARAAALFIDEAHYIGARPWSEFRGLFVDRKPPIPIVRLHAKPVRADGRLVDGEFIYTNSQNKATEIGTASSRKRVCKYVKISLVA